MRRSPFGERAKGPNVFGCRGGQDRVTGRALALALMPFLFLVSASPARATAPPDTLRLTLPAAIERALTQGEEMRQADATRAGAHALYLQARAGALPHLTLNTTYTHQYESIYGNAGGTAPTWSPDTTAALEQRVRDLEDALPGSGFLALSQLFSTFASPNSWSSALEIRQKVFQGGSIWGSVAAARHALRAARLLQDDRRADVILGVRQAYLEALLAERTAAIARLGLEQAELQLRRVRLRQEAGNASEFDLLQAEVQRDNQLPIVRGAQARRESVGLTLRRLCNIPPAAPLALSSPLLDDTALPADPAAVDSTGLDGAALRTAGITALDEAYQARGHAVTVAAAGRYPELSLYASVSQQAFPDGTFPDRRDWRRQKSAGVVLNWNVFDGFLTKGAIEQARAEQSRAGHDLAQARELVLQAVAQGRLELDRATADILSRSRTVQLARRALDLAHLRYEEGAASQLEVSDARIAWQMAQSHEAEARRDYFVALALLERYSGRPLFGAAAEASAP